MNNKKIYFIITFLVIFIIIVYSYIFINISKKNMTVIPKYTEISNYEDVNTISVDIETSNYEGFNKNQINTKISYYEKYNKILEADNSPIYIVNNEEITNKDIEITKYLYQEDNTDEAKKITLENKVVLQKLKNDKVELNEEKSNYIKDLVEDLKNNSDITSNYSNEEKEELIENLSQNLYNNTLIIQFKADFIKKLANETFSSDDKEILEKYEKCLKIQEKWRDRQGVSYDELIEAREEVYNAYIQKLISESIIE